MKELKVYDVSENNTLDYSDFEAMAADGCKSVIIRCSFGWTHKDSKFKEYYGYAVKAGLAVKTYHYGYAHNPEEAVMEAQNCKQVLEEAGVAIDIVFYDVEDPSFDNEGNDITACAKAFLDELGLNAGLYSMASWLENKIDWKSLGCPVWWAQYEVSEPDVKTLAWQYTDKEPINGKELDCSVFYVPE